MSKLLALALIFAASALYATEDYFEPPRYEIKDGWVNLDESNHIWGPTVTSEDLKGKAVLIHRWCIHCAHTRKAMESSIKDFLKLAAQYPDAVAVISYVTQDPDPKEAVYDYMKKLNVKLPVYNGFAHEKSLFVKRHAAMCIVSPSCEVEWERKTNLEIVQMRNEFQKLYEDFLIYQISGAKDPKENRRLKDIFKRLYPKSAAKLKNI